mmetsp:Transcript_16461/g.15784  ORF Transcript_16461/g.15784 Transcript_16461/m.15784 type:complete len:122 (+) Transcript_16461:55-420(+)
MDTYPSTNKDDSIHNPAFNSLNYQQENQSINTNVFSDKKMRQGEQKHKFKASAPLSEHKTTPATKGIPNMKQPNKLQLSYKKDSGWQKKRVGSSKTPSKQKGETSMVGGSQKDFRNLLTDY